MSKKQELSNWKQRLNVSHRLYEEVAKKNQVYKQYYQGKQWEGFDTTMLDGFMDLVVDNVVFSNIRAIVPRINFKNPRIFVSPKKKPYRGKGGKLIDTISGAMMKEILLNYYYKELQIIRETRRCLYDALLGTKGIMELGYTLKTEKIKDKKLLIVDELIQSESPFVKRRSPDDFRADVEGTDHLLNDRRWVAFKWIKSLQDIKDDDSFENKKDLKTNFTVTTDFREIPVQQRNQMEIDQLQDPELWDRVIGWTIWDKKTRERFDVVAEHDKFLSNSKWPTWTDAVEGFPVEVMYMNENPDEREPLADIGIYKKAQDEINLLGSMELSHVRRISQRRYLANDEALDPSAERHLQFGGDATIIRVQGNPEGKVIPLADAGISQDIYLQRRQKKQEITQMAGVSPAEGLQVQKFDTATESASLNAGSQSIRDDQRGLFEDFTTRIARKLDAILAKTLDSDVTVPLNEEQLDDFGQTLQNLENFPELEPSREFILSKLDKIVSKEGSVILQPWLTLNNEDLQGEYDFDVEVGSTQPDNEETRKRDAVQVGTSLQGNPFIRVREGTRRFLEAFKVKDVDRLLKSNEEVQKEQQAAVQAQGQGKIIERQMKDQTDLQKTSMKTQSAEHQTSIKVRGNLLATALKERKKKD